MKIEFVAWDNMWIINYTERYELNANWKLCKWCFLVWEIFLVEIGLYWIQSTPIRNIMKTQLTHLFICFASSTCDNRIWDRCGCYLMGWNWGVVLVIKCKFLISQSNCILSIHLSNFLFCFFSGAASLCFFWEKKFKTVFFLINFLNSRFSKFN